MDHADTTPLESTMLKREYKCSQCIHMALTLTSVAAARKTDPAICSAQSFPRAEQARTCSELSWLSRGEANTHALCLRCTQPGWKQFSVWLIKTRQSQTKRPCRVFFFKQSKNGVFRYWYATHEREFYLEWGLRRVLTSPDVKPQLHSTQVDYLHI